MTVSFIHFHSITQIIHCVCFIFTWCCRLQQLEAQRIEQIEQQEKLKKQQQLQWEQQQLQLAIELEQQKLKQQQQTLIEQQQLAVEAENKKKTEMAQVALNSFMNSKTPEESKLALDYYLSNSRDNGDKTASEEQQQQTQQAALVMYPQDQFAYANEPLPVKQTIDEQQVQPVDSQDTVGTYNAQELDYQLPVQDQYHYNSYMPQRAPTRNDLPVPPPRMMYPKRPNRRYRNYPAGAAQARLGPPSPSFFRGPHPPMIPGKPPIEVIYTKPPGAASGPPHPPLAAAGSWPGPSDSVYQPSKDIYWSQLYQQSYDPHYYNYIAKTGKIRPHLYGKLNGDAEADSSTFDNSIWSDLYTGFKKHGLKNMMTPGFLLGMTIPALTLVLSALVQKRSLGRSDARAITSEDVIQEYLQRLQRANECYEKKRTSRSTDNVEGCE